MASVRQQLNPQDAFLDRVTALVRVAVLEAISDYDASQKRIAIKTYKENRRNNRVEGSKPYGSLPNERMGLDLILRMRREKRTIRDIVAELDLAKFPARRGRWNPGSVLRILKREGFK
jgi:hypothetical protein